jgi:hypothetical protein
MKRKKQEQKYWIVTINGIAHPEIFTSLSKACEVANIPYWKATRTKNNGKTVQPVRSLLNNTITEASLNKINHKYNGNLANFAH